MDKLFRKSDYFSNIHRISIRWNARPDHFAGKQSDSAYSVNCRQVKVGWLQNGVTRGMNSNCCLWHPYDELEMEFFLDMQLDIRRPVANIAQRHQKKKKKNNLTSKNNNYKRTLTIATVNFLWKPFSQFSSIEYLIGVCYLLI